MRALRLLPLLAAAALGCDMPVRVGIEQARAARAQTAPTAQPSEFVSRPRAPDAAPVRRAAAEAPASAPASPPPREPPRESAGGVVLAPRIPQPSGPGDVVGVRIEARGAARRRFVSFGQALSPGQVPRGQTLAARADGRPIPTQFDVKTRHGDGSARFGVVTLAVDRSTDAMLVRVPSDAAEAVDLAAAAAKLDLKAALTIREGAEPGARTYDLGGTLARALADGRASHWLRGQLATEARVMVPVAGAMRIVADIRAHADGAVWADVQFANDAAMGPSGGTMAYDAEIALDGRSVRREAGLRQAQYQIWHAEIRTDGAPEVDIVPDADALARTGAVHSYDRSLGVSTRVLDAARQILAGREMGLLGSADVTKYMPTTGGRADIGPTTLWNAAWLVSGHPDFARLALAQSDASGSVPWNFRDARTGAALDPRAYPRLWADYRAGQWGTQALTQPPTTESGWAPDSAHAPQLSLVPYIATGARYRYDRLEAQALFAVLSLNPGYRRDAAGVVVSETEQVRAQAWAFRAVDDAAFAAPDDAPLREFVAQARRNCVDHWLAMVRAGAGGEARGFVPGENGGGTLAPWQQDFVGAVVALAASRGDPGARELADALSNFVTGRFLAADKGFRPTNAISYQLELRGLDGRAPPGTWREIEAASIAGGHARADGRPASDDRAYALAARAAQAALASATGSADARQALAWIDANVAQAGVEARRQDPTWNIAPLQR